jgi:hypothetical protein
MPRKPRLRNSADEVADRKLVEYRKSKDHATNVIEEELQDWFLGDDELYDPQEADVWGKEADLKSDWWRLLSYDFTGLLEPVVAWLLDGNEGTPSRQGSTASLDRCANNLDLRPPPTMLDGASDIVASTNRKVDASLPARGSQKPPALSRADWYIVSWYADIFEVADAPILSAVAQDPALLAAFRQLRSRLDLSTLSQVDSFAAVERITLLAVITLPLWKNTLVDWNGGSPTELLQFLLMPLAAPPAIYAWVTGAESPALTDLRDPTARINPLIWLVATARGASVHRIARYLGWRLSPALIEQVHTLSCGGALDDDLMRAEIYRLGGLEVEYRRLHNGPIFLEMSSWTTAHPYGRHRQSTVLFWQSAVRWLAIHRTALRDAQAHEVMAWGLHESLENDGFSMAGRSVRTVLALSRKYRLAIAARGTDWQTWTPQGWDWQWTGDDIEKTWRIVELTDSHALILEGAVQQHCVGQYIRRCVEKRSAIFQMSFNGKRQVTLEVDIVSKTIRQFRRRLNALPSSEDRAIVSRWTQEFGITDGTS